MNITAEHVIKFVERVAATVKEQRDYLTDLDSAIGDADHGANLDRGFSAVLTKLPTVADKDIGSILKTVGTTLVSTVGGASGPLYGTAYLRAGMVMGDRFEMSADDLVAALEAALEGIIARGKAQRGEKTMVDAIGPGIDALKAARAAGEELLPALRQAVAATEVGMLATTPMLATKGRASYLGDRSIGHQDPGATSAFLMAKAMLAVIEEP
ncbi:dihydroxyacetone kinase subunit L [Candidatus Gracilibacteria bacterium]|nr:dihydroxyacetone kinase subunit L [Candidatus Gracilibacteria bacterium]